MDGPNTHTPSKAAKLPHTPDVSAQLAWPESTTPVSSQTIVSVRPTTANTTTEERRSCLLIDADSGEEIIFYTLFEDKIIAKSTAWQKVTLLLVK